MSYMGMDVAAVEKASAELKRQAGELEALMAKIDSVVKQLPGVWEGRDARDFVENWWPGHRSRLVAVKESIAGLGQSAWNNAQEQRDVSGGSSASSSPGSGALAPSAPAPGAATDGTVGSTQPGALGAWNESAYREFEQNKSWYAAGGYYIDGNGKAVDNCTAWAAWRREELGLTAPRGDGGQMATNAGGTTDTPPSLGALVSYTDGTYGHVMVVERINGDGSITTSETNYAGSAEIKQRTWTPLADGRWQAGPMVRDLIIAR